MSEFSFSENDLRNAARAVRESMLASLPESSEIECEFSEGFLNKMDALIALDKRRQRVRLIARRAAMIVLTILVTLGAWLAVDTEARAGFVQWIKEVSRNHTIYHFFGNQPDEKLPQYALGWLPEGFTLAETDTNETGHIEIYKNKSTGYEVFFMYRSAQSGFVPMIVYDYGNETLQETVHVHDVTADYYPADENSSENTLVWIDEKQDIWFELSSGLSKEAILRMAESIS
ncbi:MAG: DUF4367 domain-containing protein [Oscillospiraceae bacterium]|nr:DUF4367 domain-containing protein [Oscillospiraceae bacterium]